ncbi:MAG: hypothetical protein K0R61_520 [Microvirga sp.]|nr:hypothetical protein [Microvirga sp.]
MTTYRKLAGKLLWSFAGNREGNVAMMFGLGAFAILGASAIAFDYSAATDRQTKMHAALDAAVLNAAKRAPELSDDELRAIINRQVKSRLIGDGLRDLDVRVSIDRANSTLTGEVTGNVPMQFAGIVGKQALPLSSASQVNWATQDVEIALVLDNTGSMNESLGGTRKIEALRFAAKSFVNYIKSALGNKPDAAKIAVVPFDTGVRLQPGHRKEAWVHKDTVTQQGDWSGCLYDRDQPHDVMDTFPDSSDAATLFKADPNRAKSSSCLIGPITPLTSNLGSLNAPIDAMLPAGNTNITVGLAWGYHVLTPSEPMTGAAQFGKKVKKYVILMTDGQNTKNRWGGNASAIDSRSREVCSNIKKVGILIYTIGTADANASLLKECASAPDMYFPINSGAELNRAFEGIAAKVSELRLSR